MRVVVQKDFGGVSWVLLVSINCFVCLLISELWVRILFLSGGGFGGLLCVGWREWVVVSDLVVERRRKGGER